MSLPHKALARIAKALNDADRKNPRALFAVGREMLSWQADGVSYQSVEKLGNAVYISLKERGLLIRPDKYPGRYFRDALLAARRFTLKEQDTLIKFGVSASGIRELANKRGLAERRRMISMLVRGTIRPQDVGYKNSGPKPPPGPRPLAGDGLTVKVPLYDPEGFELALLSILSQRELYQVCSVMNRCIERLNKSRARGERLPLLSLEPGPE